MRYVHVGIISDNISNSKQIADLIYGSKIDNNDDSKCTVKQINDNALYLNYLFDKCSATDIGSLIVRSVVEKKDVIIFVYDVTDGTSFTNIKYWLNTTNKWNVKYKKILVGLKNETKKERCILECDGKYTADAMGFDGFCEISSCDDNVDMLIKLIV